MNDAPPTKGRHALRWVLGVGLAFVVVVGMALQIARHRADEQWNNAVTLWEEGWKAHVASGSAERITEVFSVIPSAGSTPGDTRHGTVFREWRLDSWGFDGCGLVLVLTQERNFFGSNIEARMPWGRPAYIQALRGILAAVQVELVVEP